MTQDFRPSAALQEAWTALRDALDAERTALEAAGLAPEPQSGPEWEALAAALCPAEPVPAITVEIDTEGIVLDLTTDPFAMTGPEDQDTLALDLSEFDFTDTAEQTHLPENPTAQHTAALDEPANVPHVPNQPTETDEDENEDAMANRMLPPEIAASLNAAKETKGPRDLVGRLDRAAIQGEPFEGALIEPTGLEVEAVEGLDGTGLMFDAAAMGFRGTAEVSGTLNAVLIGTLDRHPVRVQVRVPVSPDPWSLWKDLPVPDDIPFPKPDQAHKRLCGDLTLLLASQRGRSHAHKALPRDDDAEILVHEASGWHIAAVADGAGSAPLSREGSRVAVRNALIGLGDMLPGIALDGLDQSTLTDPESPLRKAFFEAMMISARGAAYGIESCAAVEDEPQNAFSTTLILGAAKRVDGGWLLASFTVGDGLIGVFAPGIADNPLMMSGDSGDFAGQTVFLSVPVLEHETAPNRLHLRVVPDMTALVLMTDGVSDPMFASDQAMNDPAAWETFWSEQIAPLNLDPSDPAAAERLLDWLSFKKRGEHDDRTIVVMLPNTETETGT